jgi:hypothetical protein
VKCENIVNGCYEKVKYGSYNDHIDNHC